MKRKDFERLLESLGFVLVRSGSHRIWSDGKHSVPVPHGREMNRMVARRVLKEINYQGKVQELNYG